ncbi:MAG: PAS domain-containing protein [Alphaproteobacteria bacterium]|nr:PAS domain-containing protein [Alphaproteobacteria bacterium]
MMEHKPTLATILKIFGMLAAAYAAGFSSYEGLLRLASGKSLFSIEQAEDVPISRAVMAANIPMYWMDTNLNVIDVNDAFLDLYSLNRDGVQGKNLEHLIEHGSQYVPEKWRDCFLKQQREMLQKARVGNLPKAEAIVPLDRSSSVNPDISGKYVVWLRADRLYSKNDKFLGVWVIGRKRKVDSWDDGEIRILNRQCGLSDL